jgi:chaperone required for assembly of F1-ATPase
VTDKETNGASAGTGGARKASLPKRFYKDVAVNDEGGEAALLLDGKPVRTPGKAPLALPTRAAANAVADEWRAQGERVDPETMPLTRLANSAIDGVRGREHAVAADIVRHAGSDLLSYRAKGPQGLITAQAKHWDPVLAWAERALDAPFRQVAGVVHVEQPEASLDAVARQLAVFGPFELAALHVMTQLTGSALLPLAVALGKLTPEEAWAAAHVDEDWQIGQWGEDAEAAARRAHRKRDYDAAARMLKLTRTPASPQGRGESLR